VQLELAEVFVFVDPVVGLSREIGRVCMQAEFDRLDHPFLSGSNLFPQGHTKVQANCLQQVPVLIQVTEGKFKGHWILLDRGEDHLIIFLEIRRCVLEVHPILADELDGQLLEVLRGVERFPQHLLHCNANHLSVVSHLL